jgi:hypothetical protein
MAAQDKVKIPFVKNKSAVPVIRVRLNNGKEGYAVVDTGSESTMFDMQFVKKNKNYFEIQTTDSKMNLIGMSSSAEVPLIRATTHLRFRESPDADVKANGLVVDLSHLTDNVGRQVAMIIGSKLLAQVRGKVNYDRRYLSVYYDLPR